MLNYREFIGDVVNENISGHSYFLPSYEECRKIADEHDNFLFYEIIHEVDNYKISVFNYRLANWSHFETPIPSDPKIKAYELRGLTFVWNKDGTLYNRFLLMDKFFNIDQVPDSAYSVVKNYKIKNIYNKEDGSVSSFIRLPNGEVKGRSKTSFVSDQAIEVQKIYDNDLNIKRFVDFCMDNDIIPIFEFVSPTNRIVVPYSNTDLILLRLRDNNTGEYLDIDDYSDHLDGVTVAATEETTLDDLISAKSVVEGKEGWIVQFDNGKMVKIKTDWYFSLHGLYTSQINRENDVIKLILDETIDDVIPQLEEVKRKEIEEMIDIVNSEINYIFNELNLLLKSWNGDRKEFALENRKHPLFSVAMSVIDGKSRLDSIKDMIRTKTRNLQPAKEWIKNAKNRKNIFKTNL